MIDEGTDTLASRFSGRSAVGTAHPRLPRHCESLQRAHSDDDDPREERTPRRFPFQSRDDADDLRGSERHSGRVSGSGLCRRQPRTYLPGDVRGARRTRLLRSRTGCGALSRVRQSVPGACRAVGSRDRLGKRKSRAGIVRRGRLRAGAEPPSFSRARLCSHGRRGADEGTGRRGEKTGEAFQPFRTDRAG